MTAPREFTPDEKKAALDRVLQTASFLRAEQLRNFLRFICDMEMSGRAAQITEYLIGVEALGRAPGYSTAEDSIVRRRAIDLREKLEEVYSTELAGAPVRIDLPKGRYVPHFVRVPEAAEEGRTPARTGTVAPVRPVGGAFVAGFVAGALAASAAFFLARRTPASAAAPPAEPGLVYEGESPANTLHGATTVGTCGNCSGGARVRNIGNSASNYLVVSGVLVGADGNYSVRVDYFLQGQRSFFVSVNGAPAAEVALQGESWTSPASASFSVPLKAGPNSIKFGNDHTYAPDLDRIVVR